MEKKERRQADLLMAVLGIILGIGIILIV